MFSHGRKDYRMERKYDSPEMREAGKDIRQYLKGKYQDGGEPNKIRFVPGSYDPNEMAGYMLDEQEVVVPGKASNWGKAAIAYEKKNPEQEFIDKKKRQYLKRNKGLNKLYGLSMDNFPEDVEQNFRDEYDYKKNSTVVKQVGKKEGWNPNNRTEYVENLNDTQRDIVAESKYGSKLQPGTWNRALAGVQELGNTILPGQPFQYNIPGLTKKEQKEMRDSKLSALEVFAPMNTVGQNIANYTKNVGLSTGSDYKELPGFLSGEFMPNVDDSDAMGLDLVQLPLMLSGAAELPMLIGKGSKAVAKLMNTEDGLLSNAYKYNPLAGKLNEYNRVVGEDAILDLQNSGLVRAGDYGGVESNFGSFDSVRTTPYPSFGKGAPRQAYIDQTIQQGKKPFIISTDRPMKASNLGRHGKGSTMFPIDELGKYMSEFSGDDVKVFDAKPHWLKGYKEVPRELPGSPNTSLELGKASRTVYPQPIANSMGLREYGSTIHAGPEWGPIAPKRMILYNNSTYADPSLLDESMQPFLLPREELMRRYPTDYMSKDELIGYRFKSGIKPLEYPTEIPAHFNTQEDIMARALGKPLPSRAKPKVYYDLEGNPISEEEAVRILNTREYAYGGFINRSKLNRFIS
jgi:hypothetical protein